MFPTQPTMSLHDSLPIYGWWRSRQDDYLAAATSVTVARSPLNVIDHLERARRSPSHAFDADALLDRKSTRLNSSHLVISYAGFCLKEKEHGMSRPIM